MEKNNISCRIIEDLLPSYKDGILTDSVKDAVEYHLNNCKYCRNKLEEIESVLNDTRNESSKKDEKFISGIRMYKHYLIGITIGAGIPIGLFLIFVLYILGLTFVSN